MVDRCVVAGGAPGGTTGVGEIGLGWAGAVRVGVVAVLRRGRPGPRRDVTDGFRRRSFAIGFIKVLKSER